MNEHGDVLRVVTQRRITEQPVLETFSIVSSQEVTSLGRLELTLPVPEDLMSVRFDGTRAYVVTFERTVGDPLFTVDLTDPANPIQVGELDIPGWLHHMVPRGDRLVALGLDPGHPDGDLTVSLFDVSDLALPTLLARVNFGSSLGLAEQNRVHKAFSVVDSAGLILMPFETHYPGTGYVPLVAATPEALEEQIRGF